MRVRITLALGALALFASPAGAQTATDTVATFLRLPGKTIEILGLKRWTPAMIQDSMNVYAPGESLGSHACAAVLRYQLHFAQAVAVNMRQTDTSEYILVAAIEPQDSAFVRHRMLPRDTTDSRASWSRLVELARTRPRAFRLAVLARIRSRGLGLRPADAGWAGEDSVAVLDVWAYLDDHRTPQDAAEAYRLLAGAPNRYDRVAAVAVLTSFDREDRTWWTLASVLREPDGPVAVFASEVVGSLARSAPRRVNWKPAAGDLHALLNGAGLFALGQVLDALVATSVDPKLARPLLRGGGHAVLMYAGSATPWARGPAHRFLRVVSGRDYGGDLTRWRAWITTL